jgi:2-methylcitrate dehydratase PrpD
MTLSQELADWAAGLQLHDVPPRVVEYAKSQLLSQLAAARGGLDHPIGAAVTQAFGPLLQRDPKQSACALAAMTAWLHFDDTAYAGHISHSTVNVPCAYARSLRLDGAALLTAIIAANEFTGRVVAAATLSEFRGQTAAYTHLAGSVSARLRAENAPAEMWVSALGLAFSMPPWTLRRAFLGSDGKILCATTPVRTGLDACDVAAAGLRGAEDILEHPDGFLARFATVPLPATITRGLGQRWHTDTLSFKVQPGGPGTDVAVDCALELRKELGAIDVDDVEEVVVRGSRYTVDVERRIAPYMSGADSPVSALIFSVGYAVATALLTGSLGPRDFARPALAEPDRWALAAKIRLEHDLEMTTRFRRSEIPLGEALREAGPEIAGRWLQSNGAVGGLEELKATILPPSASFELSEKVTPARVTVRMTDGRVVERGRDIPLGGAGSDTRERHAQLVADKFLATGGTSDVVEGIASLERASADEVARLLAAGLRRRRPTSATPRIAAA